ncbi:hypothetical protein WDU94_007471 [Cyamophila willieti]
MEKLISRLILIILAIHLVQCESTSNATAYSDTTSTATTTAKPTVNNYNAAETNTAASGTSNDTTANTTSGSNATPSGPLNTVASVISNASASVISNITSLGGNCYKNPHKDGSCPYEDITFWLYTRKCQNGVQIKMANFDQVLEHVDKDKPWKIVFHGFNSSKHGPGKQLKAAYLSRDSYNMLVLDYAKPMKGIVALCYIQDAIVNLNLVAKCAANFLYKMTKAGVLPDPSKLHMIGHSLGAHIAAGTSVRLSKLMNTTVDRITGLDPAGVLISTLLTKALKRLDSKDAKFVDAHHTNNGLLAAGTWQNVGTIDIWYNYDLPTLQQNQPGCPNALLSPIKSRTCSHSRAIDYFAESINSLPTYDDKKFVGVDKKGKKQYLVGEDVSRDANGPKGDLFVKTNSKSTFGKGE